ncbi:MAG: hypothetical protein QOI21_6230 [Actinomycetota bacterium]|nr:hypothetical protein [Actinomycetota bacterium]
MRSYRRTRYYDPTTALLVTVDPAVDSTHSAYGYVAGNPLNLTDLTGLCWSGFGWACSAASWVWENRIPIEIGVAVASLAIPVVLASVAPADPEVTS